jgi:predicted membrane protein
MPQKNHSGAGSVIIGLCLVLLGVLWVLNNLEIIDFRIGEWWPVILIAVGLTTLIGARTILNPPSWILMTLGVLFLLATQGVYSWDELWKFWPIALIIIGLSIVLGRRSHRAPPKAARTVDVDEIQGSCVFGGVEKRINSQQFRGGSISALFGGAEIDLRDADLHDDGAVVQISAVFGGATLKIPDSWSVQIQSSAILGGVENKTRNQETSEGRRLVIRASALFGGVEILN